MSWWSGPRKPDVAPRWRINPRTGDLVHPNCKSAPRGTSERLTNEEISILDHLAAATNELSALDGHHPHDLQEFVAAIHQAQRIVICRAARRVNRDVLR